MENVDEHRQGCLCRAPFLPFKQFCTQTAKQLVLRAPWICEEDLQSLDLGSDLVNVTCLSEVNRLLKSRSLQILTCLSKRRFGAIESPLVKRKVVQNGCLHIFHTVQSNDQIQKQLLNKPVNPSPLRSSASHINEIYVRRPHIGNPTQPAFALSTPASSPLRLMI